MNPCKRQALTGVGVIVIVIDALDECDKYSPDAFHTGASRKYALYISGRKTTLLGKVITHVISCSPCIHLLHRENKAEIKKENKVEYKEGKQEGKKQSGKQEEKQGEKR